MWLLVMFYETVFNRQINNKIIDIKVTQLLQEVLPTVQTTPHIPKFDSIKTTKQNKTKITFHMLKLILSTTVGCTISFPGNTPQVTAMGWPGSQLVHASEPSWLTR